MTLAVLRKTTGAAQNGFTLVELITALSVMAVAVAVFTSFFSASLDLSRQSRNQSVAASLAGEKLGEIQRNPELFQWGRREGVVNGAVAPRAEKERPDGYPFDPPEALPQSDKARTRVMADYEAFRWSAQARTLEGGDAVEVTVVVRWLESGRPRSLCLTSAVESPGVEAAASAPAQGGAQ